MGDILAATLRNDIGEIARVASLVDEFGLAHGWPAGFMHDVQVCLDEVLSNVIRHAFDDASAHEIELRMQVASRRLAIEVTDDGRAFDPLAFEPEVPRGAQDRKPGGLGIYFVRRLMDEVGYRREGRFNRLVMTKALPAP